MNVKIIQNKSALSTLEKAGFIMPDGQPLKQMASYEGAQGGRRLGGWQATSEGPNAINLQDLATLRDRCRDAIRNNAWLSGAIQTFSSDLIGRGIRPRWVMDDKDLKQKIHDAWDRWVDECDADGNVNFYGMQELVAKTVWQSGEQLVRFRPRRLQDTLSVPLQLQCLEPDFLSSLNDGLLENGNFIRMGIELTPIGSRAAYWLYKSHPGEGTYFFNNNLTTYRIPATQIAHIYRVDRPGQLRGVPWMSSALARLYMFDNYEDSELDRKKTAAMFAAFIKSNPQEGGVQVGFDAETQTDDLGQSFATLEPGILQYLLPGEDVVFSNPADVGANYEVFIKQQLRAIAASIGMTYEQFTGDLKGVNYTSIRQGALQVRRKLTSIQHNVIIFQFCRRVAQVWLATAVASGKLSLPGFADDPSPYHRVQWQPDGWPWVDPLKEVNAARQSVLSGFTSRTAVVAGNGRDAEEVDEELHTDQARADELGLELDIDDRQPALAAPSGGGEPGSDGEEAGTAPGEKGPAKPAEPGKPPASPAVKSATPKPDAPKKDSPAAA